MKDTNNAELERLDRRSYSQLSNYSQCGKQYQLERIVGVPVDPAVWFPAGSALHACFETINRAAFAEQENIGWHVDDEEQHLKYGVSLTDIDPAYLWYSEWLKALGEIETETPQSEWRTAGRRTKDKPNKEDVTWWAVEGERQVIDYRAWLSERMAQGWKILAINGVPAIEFGGLIAFGDVAIKYFVDVVFLLPDGSWLIVDYKTGSRVPMPLQLGVYRAALVADEAVDVTGIAIRGAFLMTRKMEMSEFFNLNHYTPQLFADYFGSLNKGIKSNIFLPHVSDMCRGCGVQQFCSAVNGIFAAQFDPSHPDWVAQEVK